MKKKTEHDVKVMELHIDTNLKNAWVDNIHLAVRDDGVSVVRLSTNLPEGLFEQLRFITTKKQLEEFADVICKTINYYPSKDDPIKKS